MYNYKRGGFLVSKKGFIVGLIFVLVGTGLLLAPNFPVAYAQDEAAREQIEKLKQKREELSRQIRENREKAAAKAGEAKELKSQIDSLTQEIAELERRINELQGQINQVTGEISAVKQEIAQKEEELQREREKLNQALIEIYLSTSKSDWEIILGSSSFSEGINQTKYLEAIEFQIEKIIEEITRIKQELENQRNELEVKNAQLKKIQAQQAAYQRGAEKQKGQKNQLLTNTEAAKAGFEKKLGEAKREYTNVNSVLYKLQEIAKRRAGQRPPGEKVVTNITWVWPLGGPITTYFGGRTPFQPQGGHAGIDIAAPYGTAVVAAADGKVTFVGSSLGYGDNVRLDHGGGYSSLYGHFDGFAVLAGQDVKRGEVLGFIGMTGWTTGPHLHFEIRDPLGPDDPLAYLP